ncbi:response regulator [Cohnella soli]|uniref:Response regulator n=1 Tax=Cohnella soli TaxID=425005 RepID=A0ABW0HZY5_9BACL
MYKVFIVDDEPFISEGLIDAVNWSEFGLEIVGSAEDGEEALERLKQVPADILITDISMPIMNGLELIRHARETLPHLKVIVLSGYNEFDYLKTGMKLGIENYLLKPVHFEELEATLSGTVAKLNAEKQDRVFGEDEIDILRDNIMSRWVAGRIAFPELAERTALLGIDLSWPYVVVAIVRTAEGDQGMVDSKLDERFEATEGYVRFRDVDGNTVLAFGMTDPELEKRKIAGTLREMNGTGGIRDIGMRISIGDSVAMAEASVSYEQARKAQQYFLVMPDSELIDYAQLQSVAEQRLPSELLDWDTYAKPIMAKDKEGLLSQIAADFSVICLTEGLNPARTKGAAVELLIHMKMETDKLNRPDSTEAYKAALDQVVSADTLDGVEAAVKEAAIRTIDSFAGEDVSPIVKQVLRYIQDHYEEALTLKSLGQMYHIHPNYLGQLFHKQTGESFADYINKFRIDKAKHLLTSSHLKVNEIAKQVGYWDIGYFYKQFKKHVGIVPGEYKGLQ